MVQRVDAWEHNKSPMAQSLYSWWTRTPAQNAQHLHEQSEYFEQLMQNFLATKNLRIWVNLLDGLSSRWANSTAFTCTFWTCKALEIACKDLEKNGCESWYSKSGESQKIVPNEKLPGQYAYVRSEQWSKLIWWWSKQRAESIRAADKVLLAQPMDPGVNFKEYQKQMHERALQVFEEQVKRISGTLDAQSMTMLSGEQWLLYHQACKKELKNKDKNSTNKPIDWENLNDPVYEPIWSTYVQKALTRWLQHMGVEPLSYQYAYAKVLNDRFEPQATRQLRLLGISQWLDDMNLSVSTPVQLPLVHPSVTVGMQINGLQQLCQQSDSLEVLRHWQYLGHVDKLTLGTKGKPSGALTPVQWIEKCVKHWSQALEQGANSKTATHRLVHDLRLIGLEDVLKSTMRGKPYGLHVLLSMRKHGHKNAQSIHWLNECGVYWSSKALGHLPESLVYECNNDIRSIRYSEDQMVKWSAQLLDTLQVLYDQSPDGIGTVTQWKPFLMRFLNHIELFKTPSCKQAYTQRMVQYLVHTNTDMGTLIKQVPKNNWGEIQALMSLVQQQHLEKSIGVKAFDEPVKKIKLRL